MLSWEHIYEYALKMAVLPRLKDAQQMQRFNAVKNRYSDICSGLLEGAAGSNTVSKGYDWTEWAGAVRRAFNDGVPVGFLAHPTLSFTMVFGRRRGVKLTRIMINDIEQVFGTKDASRLIHEDYIGLPAITDSTYMTSANRCHHASHLATYTKVCNKKFWDSESIIEWGGGYGNMARIIRKMNPSITYTIIDLPELLALQYIYLASLEGGDNVHIVQSGIEPQLMPGKINLLSSKAAVSSNALRCDSFISTWAITESPQDSQKLVREKEFFGAKNILLASLINENNYLAGSLDGLKLSRLPVPASKGIGEGHEYWLR
jgi:hypothetical protein